MKYLGFGMAAIILMLGYVINLQTEQIKMLKEETRILGPWPKFDAKVPSEPADMRMENCAEPGMVRVVMKDQYGNTLSRTNCVKTD